MTKLMLGDTARDTITGFEGVVVARCQWLNGCVRITIQPRKLQDNGKPVEYETFDEAQCELVEGGKRRNDVARRQMEDLTPTPAMASTGGPYPNPTRSRDPR